MRLNMILKHKTIVFYFRDNSSSALSKIGEQ